MDNRLIMKNWRSCILVPLLLVCTLATAQNSAPTQLDSAVVVAGHSGQNRGNVFVFSPIKAAKSITAIGEPDVIRHITSMPGVSQGVEGTLGLFVRGANGGSNRIEFNGVPLSSYSHLLGLFSAVNPATSGESIFRSGGVGADHGDFSSSVIEIAPRAGLRQGSVKQVSVSPYMIGGYLSKPIKDGTRALQIGARVSPFPLLGNFALDRFVNDSKDDEFKQNLSGRVADLTILLDGFKSEKSKTDFMLYASDDYFQWGGKISKYSFRWWTWNAKAGWAYQLSDKTDIYSKAYYSRSCSWQKSDTFYDGASTLYMENSESELDVSSKATVRLRDGFLVYGGAELSYKRFRPANSRIYNEGDENSHYISSLGRTALSAFASAEYTVPGVIESSLGIRPTLALCKRNIRANFDFHAKADVFFNRNLGAEAVVDRMVQYHHVLEGLPVGWSVDIRIPSYADFPEEITNQGYLGLFYKYRNIHTSFGGYYRRFNNLVSYITSSNVFLVSTDSWDKELCLGKGSSAGLEYSITISGKKYDASLSYTLSRTDREFPEINGGRRFLFKYDRPHILNIQGNYRLGRHHIFNAALSYSSGNLVSLPESAYPGVQPPFWNQRLHSEESLTSLYLMKNREEFNGKNGFRLKDYTRIDISYTYEKKSANKTNSLTVSVFNVLNQHNPILIYNKRSVWTQVSILPIMPSIRWSIEF